MLLATLVGVAVIIYFVVMVWDIIQGLDPADRAPEVLFKVACAVCVVSGVGLGMMLQQGLVALVKLAIGPPKAERLLCRLTLESESESRSLYRSKG